MFVRQKISNLYDFLYVQLTPYIIILLWAYKLAFKLKITHQNKLIKLLIACKKIWIQDGLLEGIFYLINWSMTNDMTTPTKSFGVVHREYLWRMLFGTERKVHYEVRQGKFLSLVAHYQENIYIILVNKSMHLSLIMLHDMKNNLYLK